MGGFLFLPKDEEQARLCVTALESIVVEEGQKVLGWRSVPVDNALVGPSARSCEPVMRQVFIGREAGNLDQDGFERRLFKIRKRLENTVSALRLSEQKLFYVVSLSSRTVVYKGMLTPEQVGPYFKDLADKDFESALCLTHSRFSTNTFPSWDLAHPFRFIAHNGEINTLRGNINWMHAREALFATPHFPNGEMRKMLPIVREGQSDSATLDNALEMLVGRPLLAPCHDDAHPEAWQKHKTMPNTKRTFTATTPP
jgi:glutamate synthase domain-containing protein 1